MDIGNGTKAMMKVGEIVDWVDGTQRFVSQQIFLTRYTKKGDKAAGVEADKSLGENDFVIRAVINEMKGATWNTSARPTTCCPSRVAMSSGTAYRWGGADEQRLSPWACLLGTARFQARG